MKAITLVDEMPSKCHGCPYDDFDFRCKLTGFDHEDYVMRGTRDIRCPLKPMPMKRISTVDWLHTETQTQSATSIGKYPSDYTQIKTYEPSDYDKGWNDCVDFMEGGEQ